MIIDEQTYLAHYGILRRSGRYPWGSGGNQSTRNRTFLDMIDGLRRQGMTEKQIADSFSTPEHPFTTTMLRAAKSIAKNQQKQSDIAQAQRLKEKGYSNVEIGRRMKINESSVRALLAPGQRDKADVLVKANTAIVRGLQTENGDRMRFTRVYVKQQGLWKLLACEQNRVSGG